MGFILITFKNNVEKGVIGFCKQYAHYLARFFIPLFLYQVIQITEDPS